MSTMFQANEFGKDRFKCGKTGASQVIRIGNIRRKTRKDDNEPEFIAVTLVGDDMKELGSLLLSETTADTIAQRLEDIFTEIKDERRIQ